MAATAPDKTAAHRAGPVETDLDGRHVQRCLRCDVLLRIVWHPPRKRREPIDVGDYVVAERPCRGSFSTTMLQYEDD